MFTTNALGRSLRAVMIGCAVVGVMALGTDAASASGKTGGGQGPKPCYQVDNPETGCTWGGGGTGGPGTVVLSFNFLMTNSYGNDVYERKDGMPSYQGEANRLATALGYKGCTPVTYAQKDVQCWN